MNNYRAQSIAQLRELAQRNLASQAITYEHYWEGNAHWRLTFPDKSTRAAWSILAVDFGRLIVHGDWTPVVFSGSYASDALERLKWLGDTDDVSYCAEKASQGGSFQVWVPSQEAFDADLKELLAGPVDEHADPDVLEEIQKRCVDREFELTNAIGELFNPAPRAVASFRARSEPGDRVRSRSRAALLSAAARA